ncbi:MAG: DnaA/Hda family protein [Pirellulaceae bacterium]
MTHDVIQSEKDVAAQVRSALIDRISSERYDLWIPETTKWNWQDGVLTLVFASDFSCTLAKKMLTQELASAARDALGSNVEGLNIEVVFEVDTQIAQAAVPVTKSPAKRVAASLPNTAQHVGDPAGTTVDAWDHFIPGVSNQLAWTTASMVLAEPGRLTPVLLHGPTGSGKSLLVTAIAQRLRGSRRMRRVVQMTSEQFTNDFTEGLRGGGLPMFRRKYRDVEALILEDVQFFFGKKSTLAEVRHTIDNLLRLGKQVVVTADRPLTELGQLGNELTGRLRGGLSAPLMPLDEAIRTMLLARQLRAANVDVDEKLVKQLASRICGDGRVIHGIVHRLTAVAALHPSAKLSWDQCWNAVFDLVQATQPIIRLADIDRAVCSMFGLDAESLQSQSKTRNLSQPRMLAMFLARRYTPAAYKEIGQYFGHRRHSTVISAERTVQTWLSENSTAAWAWPNGS